IWVIGMWLTSKWRPILVFSRKSFKDLFAFGSKLMASSFLYEIFAQSYPVIIGKFFSASQVGFYNRAESYQKITSYTISSMVNSVTFPALSLIQNDDQRLREAYRRIIKMTMLITVPLMAGLILIARPLIITLITAKWIQVVPYLQWMCVVGMFQPINVINLNIVNVKGRSDLYLYLIIANKVLIVLSIFVGYFWGIIGILIGQVFTAVISYAMSAYLADRFIKYSVFQQAKDIAPYFLLSTGMCIIGYLSGHYIDNLVVKMLLQIAVCMGFYYAMARVLKLTALDELISLITNFIRRKPSERKE
ncbi:MAG: oligosaccharide flippase family protein, partial [Bacteroidota bacterium]